MTTEIGYYLLEQLKHNGADDVVISISNSENQQIKFGNNKIATTKNWESKNIGMFVTKDKRIISTALKTFDEKSAKELSQKIMNIIQKLPKNQDYESIANGPFKYSQIPETYDPKIEDFNEEMIDYVKQSIDIVK